MCFCKLIHAGICYSDDYLYLDLYLLLTGKTFGPLHFSRQDLGVLTIMRGRDHGLADYNTVRKTLKLGEIKSWTDLNPDLPDSVCTIFLL